MLITLYNKAIIFTAILYGLLAVLTLVQALQGKPFFTQGTRYQKQTTPGQQH